MRRTALAGIQVLKPKTNGAHHTDYYINIILLKMWIAECVGNGIRKELVSINNYS